MPERRPRRFFLAVHSIERDDAVGELKFAEQLLGCGNFVGLVRDIDMGQDQAGFGVECVQHLGCLAVIEVVEASPECLAIERDDTSRWIGCGAPQAYDAGPDDGYIEVRAQDTRKSSKNPQVVIDT